MSKKVKFTQKPNDSTYSFCQEVPNFGICETEIIMIIIFVFENWQIDIDDVETVGHVTVVFFFNSRNTKTNQKNLGLPVPHFLKNWCYLIKKTVDHFC